MYMNNKNNNTLDRRCRQLACLTTLRLPCIKIHQRGGAVETGCSDLYDVIY